MPGKDLRAGKRKAGSRDKAAGRDPMQSLKPTVWIGKKGCTPEAILEIRRQLEARKPVKVRFLRGAEMDPELLARETGGELLGVRGRMVVLERGR